MIIKPYTAISNEYNNISKICKEKMVFLTMEKEI